MKLGLVTQSISSIIEDMPLDLAKGLSERGHTVAVITTHITSPREQPYREQTDGKMETTSDGIEFRFVPAARLGRDMDLCAPWSRALMGDFDALVLHEDYPLLSKVAFLWARRQRIPTVMIFERYYYPPRAVASVSLRALDRLLHPVMWNGSQLLLYRSHECRTFFTELGAPSAISHYFPGWVDAVKISAIADRARETASPSASETTEILSIGRLTPHKGYDVLLQAIRLLQKRTSNVHVRIQGRGPMERELRRTVADFGLGNVVEIRSALAPRTQIFQMMGTADIYVQPSRIEPFGVAAVEAMASGLPVVAASVGGLADSVVDGKTGFLVPSNDPIRLCEALERLVRDRDRARAMGKKGQERALGVFDIRGASQRFETMVHEVIA